MTPFGRTRAARWTAAVVGGTGAFCLVYHLVFYLLWRFLFGEEVWPWPRWSLYFLVIVPAVSAVMTVAFYLGAGITRKNLWIAAAIGALSLFGLFGFAAEVWKVMVQLGFHP